MPLTGAPSAAWGKWNWVYKWVSPRYFPSYHSYPSPPLEHSALTYITLQLICELCGGSTATTARLPLLIQHWKLGLGMYVETWRAGGTKTTCHLLEEIAQLTSWVSASSRVWSNFPEPLSIFSIYRYTSTNTILNWAMF